MKRKFLAKAITLGLMLAVPLGAQAAVYTPAVDGNNLTYKISEGVIGTLDRLSLSNDTNGNTIYNSSKVNNLTIIKNANDGKVLFSLSNNKLEMNIDGTFTIQDTVNNSSGWHPTVHMDTSDTNINIFNVKAKDIIVEGGSSIGFNLYSRNDNTKAEANLEAQDSVKITAGDAAINLNEQKTNIINVAAGKNITIESDNSNAMSVGKEATATLEAGEEINLKSRGSRSALNNRGNMSVQAKALTMTTTGNDFAVSNSGTLKINENLADLADSQITFNSGITNSGVVIGQAENINVNSDKTIAVYNNSSTSTITLNANNRLSITTSADIGLYNLDDGCTNLNAKEIVVRGGLYGIRNGGQVNINQAYDQGKINETTLNITNRLYGVNTSTLNAKAGSITVNDTHDENNSNYAVYTDSTSSVTLEATSGDLTITSNKGDDNYYNKDYGVMANGTMNLNAKNGNVIIDVYQRGLQASAEGNVDIKAKKVDITSGTHAINAYGGSTVTIEAEKIYLNAKNGIDPTYGDYELGINVSSGSKVELKNAKEVSVIGGISTKGTDDNGKVSSVDINASDNIYIQGTIKNVGETKLDTVTTAGNINIGSDNQNTIIKIDGNIYSGELPGAIEKDEDGKVTGNTGVAKAEGGSINIALNNKESSLNGNIYDKDAGQDENNGVHLEVNNGATWSSNGNSTVKEVKSNGGVIDLAGTDQTVDIKKITSNGDSNQGTTIKTDSIDNKLTIGNNESKLDVVASGKVTDSIGNDIQGGMKKLLNNIKVTEGTQETTIKAEAGAVTGETTIYRDESGNTSAAVEEVNKDNAGISEMASIGLMAWRAENNDMNKRLGELRSSKGEHGVWTRMVRGQSKYGAQGIKNQYSTYQLGYDEKLSVDKHWTVGAAVSYTDASSSFTTGHGENKSTGLAVYGSYLGDNGSFVDLIAKVARLKNEFDVMGGAGKGDYETNGYSLSAEYGKRFTKDNGFWIEPQVELTYGYVSTVDYLTSNDVSVRQNGMDSLVGRIGFSIGRDINAGNVYARASYLYDFDGETDVSFSKDSATRSFKQDLGGGWWEVGVGTNLNLSEATHLYFDVEKTYSGNVATPWQWNAGVRWSF